MSQGNTFRRVVVRTEYVTATPAGKPPRELRVEITESPRGFSLQVFSPPKPPRPPLEQRFPQEPPPLPLWVPYGPPTDYASLDDAVGAIELRCLQTATNMR